MNDNKSIIEFSLEVVLESDDNGFRAYCPALKGLHTWGKTREQALRNAEDAATAYMQSLIKHGDPIPVGNIKQKRMSKSHNIAYSPKHFIADLKIACAI